MPEIVRENHLTHGAYRTDVEGADRQAELTWFARGDARIIDHTYVPPQARGKGVAAQLMHAIIADAREQGFRIVPQCSYAEAAFRRHPEWTDLLADMPS